MKCLSLDSHPNGGENCGGYALFNLAISLFEVGALRLGLAGEII